MHAEVWSLFMLAVKFPLTHYETAERLLEISIFLTWDPALE